MKKILIVFIFSVLIAYTLCLSFLILFSPVEIYEPHYIIKLTEFIIGIISSIVGYYYILFKL